MISRERLRQANKHAQRRARFIMWDASDWRKLRDVTKPCSSWCCGNERRWFGIPPIQERRQAPDRSH
jgi:hypothetical protein